MLFWNNRVPECIVCCLVIIGTLICQWCIQVLYNHFWLFQTYGSSNCLIKNTISLFLIWGVNICFNSSFLLFFDEVLSQSLSNVLRDDISVVDHIISIIQHLILYIKILLLFWWQIKHYGSHKTNQCQQSFSFSTYNVFWLTVWTFIILIDKRVNKKRKK